MPIVGSSQLFKITTVQTYLDQTCKNVWWYLATGPGAFPALAVAQEFQSDVFSQIQVLLSDQNDHVTTECDEVTSQFNFVEIAGVGNGGVLSTDVLPSFITLAIKLVRTTKETRSGYKRFSGQVEPNMAGNSWIPTLAPAWASAINAMSATVVVAGSGDMEPVIVRQTRDQNNDLLPPEDWIYNFVSDALFQDRVSTQNSRKPGRGE